MKNHPLLFILLLLITLCSFSACDLINPEEQVPSYIYVEPYTLQLNPDVDAGSLDHKITHVFAYAGAEFLGIFALPALIPVLQEGEQQLILDAGIRDNGVSTTIQIYPFYERYEKTIDLNPGQIDTLQPVTRYRSDTRVHFIEDFEAGLPVFSEDRDGNPLTFMESSTEEVFEGSKSGLISLDTLNPFFDVGTNRAQLFALKGGGKIYLEVNYKTDVDLLFGLLEIDNTGHVLSNFEYGLLARDTWHKVYFNLTELVLVTNADEYQVAVTGGLPIENGKFAISEAKVYLDNIKLISF
ncbi:MAG: hypothetical protein IPL49_09480 [Saprospirales bacterium]|nr:hypothetical protein [Saprospirales bacterium]MBK8491100.1 hypothetical protein [Saprospirales bacterium]